MRSAHRFLQILQGQVGVELGAGDLGMPQDGLDVPQVRLVAQQVGGHGVAETVRQHNIVIMTAFFMPYFVTLRPPTNTISVS